LEHSKGSNAGLDVGVGASVGAQTGAYAYVQAGLSLVESFVQRTRLSQRLGATAWSYLAIPSRRARTPVSQLRPDAIGPNETTAIRLSLQRQHALGMIA
jgi:hypothetical protein